MTAPHIREAGDSALLLELDPFISAAVNARAIAIARGVHDRNVPGVRDVVPAYTSVAVHFDPLVADPAALRSMLEEAARLPAATVDGARIEVPVRYGGEAGPDLADVARFSGLTERGVIECHAGRDYRVFMLGFLPGFPYLGTVDDSIAIPRRESPRLRVGAGSVGIAGRQTGIYPRDSPGGWQIIGRTPIALFDPYRTPPALFAPGDAVRFVPAAGPGVSRSQEPASISGWTDVSQEARPVSAATPATRHITVVRPGLLTTIQDGGRWGHQASGVPVAGPLDWFSHRLANALVGNRDDAATLEVTIAGPELRFDDDAWAAMSGADLDPTLDGAPVALDQPVRCPAGSVLRFGERRRGARAYLAVDGGIASPPVLGSRATHVLSGLGGMHGRAIRAGDRLPLGPRGNASDRRVPSSRVSMPEGGAKVRIMRGPHDDTVPEQAFDTLRRTRFIVGSQSNRMGYRLTGGRVPRAPYDGMISTATFSGAVQLPPSGEPILLMADRQTTGGYPQIASVITADQPLAGQLAPGDWVEFEVCSRREAIEALVAREGALCAGR